jgi:hypothetical protein
VPRGWIIALTLVMLALGAVVLYCLWALWPNGKGEEQTVTLFGAHFTVSSEQIFFVMVALSGALGGLVHTVRSFSMYVGTCSLRWSWIPFNLLLPVVRPWAEPSSTSSSGGLFSSRLGDRCESVRVQAVAAVGLFSSGRWRSRKEDPWEMFAGRPS